MSENEPHQLSLFGQHRASSLHMDRVLKLKERQTVLENFGKLVVDENS